MTSKPLLLTTVSFGLLFGTFTATAQENPLVPEAGGSPQGEVFQRIIKEGCAPRLINDAIRYSAFDALATWLDRQGKPQEARRIRAISEAEQRQFLRNEQTITESVATGLSAIGKGGRWDAARNISVASGLLGGTDGVIRYIAAARDAQLEVYRRPSTYFYQTPNLDLSKWVRPGPAQDGMTALNPEMSYLSVRGGFEVPYTFNQYLLQGRPYQQIMTIKSGVDLAVNTDALAAMERTRADQADAISRKSQVPLRQTLASKMAEKPDTKREPTDEADVALTYAAWLPNLCIGMQLSLSPIHFAQKAVEDVYIAPLKQNGTW